VILGPLQYVGNAPTRAHPGDAGFDLHAVGRWVIHAGAWAEIPLGTSVKCPEHTWALLTGRSSTFRNRRLLVGQGVIDTGYTGPLFAVVRNLGDTTEVVEDGERIAQLVLMPNLAESIELVQVESLPGTSRGSNGFGSSGR
jgi:dUTP pyrophosphatase